METMIARLSKTTKKDYYGDSRQDNIVLREEGEPLSYEIMIDSYGLDYLLITTETGYELGEISGDKAHIILRAIKHDSVPVITVNNLIDNPSGTTSINVKIVIYDKFEARERGLLTYEFFTKLAGVTQTNADGRPRQDIIANELQEEQELFLAREPENQYDPNAIAVITSLYSEKVGYLSKKVAAEIAPQIDQHQLVTCQIKNITGTSESDKSLGVNLLLRVYSLADTENIARNTASKYQKEAQIEPAEVLPIEPEPVEAVQEQPQSEPMEVLSPAPEPVELIQEDPQPEPVEVLPPTPEPVEIVQEQPQPQPVEVIPLTPEPVKIIQTDPHIEPVEVLPIEPEPVKIIQMDPQSEPTTSRFVKVNAPPEFITAPQTTTQQSQTSNPKAKNKFFSKVASWWRARSKKARIWIIVIVIILLIGICGNM